MYIESQPIQCGLTHLNVGITNGLKVKGLIVRIEDIFPPQAEGNIIFCKRYF
ncbi:MAG: hypothetical protein K9I68_08190 [Bacteroidales bacterium]|nr:hypothetical protein [Bacteroidales bacterium]